MKKNMRTAYALIMLIVFLFMLISCGSRQNSIVEAQDGKELIILDDENNEKKDDSGNPLTVKVVLLGDDMLKAPNTDGSDTDKAAYVKLGKAKDQNGNEIEGKTYVSQVLDSEKNVLRDASKIVEVVTVSGVKKYAKYNADGTRDNSFLYVEDKDSRNAAEDKDNKNYQKKWNEYILTPVGWLMTQVNNLVKNYIITLFIFAILVKLLFLYFSIRQHKSSIKQAYFKPKEQAIRNKYKGRTDQATMQKMQQEIMDAQQKEGVSAFSGCLPLLIQLPVIFLLYEVIRNPLSYVAGYGKQCIASIKNVICYNDISGWDLTMLANTSKSAITGGNIARLQELDLVPLLRGNFDAFSNVFQMGDKTAAGLPNFFAFGKYVDLSYTPQIPSTGLYWLYLLIPVLTFVTLFFSMKLNRKMTAPSTQAPAGEGQPDMKMANVVMDLGMPLMSTVFTFMVPSLLGVYWIFNNLLGTLQQFILVKAMPYPVFTEEDYKKAEREYNKGKEVKKAAQKDPNRPKVRSLHHIDDDEEEDYPTLPPIDEERTAGQSVMPKATLKSDDRSEEQIKEKKDSKKEKKAKKEEKTEENDSPEQKDNDGADSSNTEN